MQPPKVTILILNWKGWRDTIACLESLITNTYPNCQVVVIDNDSQDESIREITAWASGRKASLQGPLPCVFYDRETAEQGGFPASEEDLSSCVREGMRRPLVVIQTGANLGFAGGNNVGMRYALKRGADYILLLNNDAALRTPDALEVMVSFMERTPGAGACGGRLFYPDGRPQQAYGNFPTLMRALAYLFPLYKLLPEGLLSRAGRSNVVPDRSILQPIRVDYPSGAFLLARSTMIREIGLLDERYFMYAEETDWCIRMKKGGWDRYYVPQAEALHKFAGSLQSMKPTMLKYFLASLFHYYQKHLSTDRLWVLFTAYWLRSLWSSCLWRAASLVFPRRMKPKIDERADYWSFARARSARSIKELLAGATPR